MAKKNVRFEDSLARLEEILHALEGGDLALDEMLKLYEEGIALLRSCNEQLENAEQRVRMITLQADGSVGLTDFDRTEEQ